MLVDILVSHHHQHFLIMAGPKDSDVARARLSGARNALLSHGFTDTNVVYGDYSYDSARECLSAYAEKMRFLLQLFVPTTQWQLVPLTKYGKT